MSGQVRVVDMTGESKPEKKEIYIDKFFSIEKTRCVRVLPIASRLAEVSAPSKEGSETRSMAAAL